MSSLSDLSTIHYGKSPSEVLTEDGPYPIVGTGGIYGHAKRAMFPSAIVVPRKGSLGNPQLIESPFWPVDTTYAVIPKDRVDIRLLYYCLLNFDLTKFNEATGVPSISREWLSKIQFHNPGRENQKKISKILKSLDQTIEKTEALIQKYQQIKQGLMHDLFTRGVTPDGKLRPTREQAPELYKETQIGWIPQQWEIVPINKLCVDVVDCPHSTPIYTEEGIPCVRTADMEIGQLLIDRAYKVDYNTYLKRIQRLTPQKGDIIYSREGERLGIASPAGEDPVCLGQRVMILRPSHDTDPDFLLWSMNVQGFYRQVISGLGATTSPHVNVGDIKKIITYRPPPKEQEIIGKALSIVQNKLSREELFKKKIVSKKSGLMHDLLTGQVQVKVSE